MSDLDNKLRQIITGIIPDIDDETTTALLDRVIPKLKQAFANEGYKKHDKAGCIEFDYDDEQKANMIALVMSKMGFKEPVMTGQAFYDRFEKELDKVTGISEPLGHVLEAARRAAGLE